MSYTNYLNFKKILLTCSVIEHDGIAEQALQS